MKRILLALTCSMIAFAGISQDKIDVRESNEKFSVGNNNALTVVVYGSTEKDVEKAWVKALKDMKGNVKSKDEIFADDCRIKKMSDNTFDVYSRIEEVEGGHKIIAGFDLGGAFLSSSEHKEFFPYVRDIMYNVAVDETKAAIGLIVKEETKKLEELQDEQKDMEKDVKDLEKEIEDMEKKIEENKKKIEETNKEIEEKKGEVKEQEKVVESVEAKQKAVK